jgi:phosphopantetheinyl transferase
VCAQIDEKKIIEKERQEEERRLDTIMEIERLKALKMYEERDRRRAVDNKLGAQVAALPSPSTPADAPVA